MKKQIKKKSYGFTLIEVIIVMVIVGILAAGLSMGLTRSIEKYFFEKEASRLSQQAQVAMARINRELIDATRISSISGTQVDYTRPFAPPSCRQVSGCQYRIQLTNGAIVLQGINPAFGAQQLIRNVAAPSGGSFLLFKNFKDADWSLEAPNYTVNDLARIIVEFKASYGSGGSLTFIETINPRQGNKLNIPRLN